MDEPKKLDNIHIGDQVIIKTDSGDFEEGNVQEIITKVHMHHLGIKVRLDLNKIGRIQKIFPRVSEQEKNIELQNEFQNNFNLDEGETLEFKATFLYDFEHFKKTQEVIPFEKGPHSIAKTIAAFANHNGGVLYIGIQDKPRVIIGLKNDYALLKYKPDSDGFLMKLKNSMESLIGKDDFHQCVSVRKIIHDTNGDICVLKIIPSKIPIILKTNNGTQLYVREGDDSIEYESIQSFCAHWHEHMKKLGN